LIIVAKLNAVSHKIMTSRNFVRFRPNGVQTS